MNTAAGKKQSESAISEEIHKNRNSEPGSLAVRYEKNGEYKMRSNLTTLCYIEQDGKYLMMHRVKKEHDINKDKWVGIGGHFEADESPEECLLREAREETGLTLLRWRLRGIVTFICDRQQTEYMFLYTADAYSGEMTECSEGCLEWVEKSRVNELPVWEGDKIFFRLLEENEPFFSLKLKYEGDVLVQSCLNGKDICQETVR